MALAPETDGSTASQGAVATTASDERAADSTLEPPRRPSRRLPSRRWLVAAALVVALLAAGGISVATAYSADIARGVHVLGVDVGAMSRAEAAQVLRGWLAGRVAAPVPVRVGGTTAEIIPTDAGLALDVDATVATAARAQPNPLTALFGRHQIDPTVTVDVERLYTALQPHVGAEAVAPTNPAIRYAGLTAQPVYPASGKGLDRDRAAEIFRATWLRRPTVEVPITDVTPQMTREDVDRLVRELAVPAVAAPVTVTTQKGEFVVPPAAIAGSLLLESDAAGRIVARIDDAKLRQALGDRLRAVEIPAKNATITLQSGQPVVTPHVDGQGVDVAALARDLVPVLGQPAPRRISATLSTTSPKVTSDQIAQLGIKEKVSSFTTNFVAGQSRTVNIRKVADLARGTLVRPGETFSLNALTGERTLAKGYVPAPAIVDGKIKNGPGGGISQFATTLFNAMYYAGLQDIAHRPHSYWFSRYPSVIEATTVFPDLDLKFRNDSPHGILIGTSYTATSLTVTMWGTKRYDIETVWGPRTNQTAPSTIYLQEADCNPTDGIPGFQQEAWRIFKQGGKEVKRERFFWRYSAEPKFICGPPPA